MKLDLRNRDLSKPITFKMLWIQDSFKKLRKILPENIKNADILNYLVDKYTESLDTQIGRFYNNVNQHNSKMTVEQFINMFINTESTMSGYGALYDNQNVAPNLITIKALENLLDKRKHYKKLMNSYPEGSDEYIMYDVIQKTYKILANSYYGILGLKASAVYNNIIQNSITKTGVAIITTAISTMESFLSDSNKFDFFDDLAEFVLNVTTKKYKYNILDYVDEVVSEKKLAEYLYGHLIEQTDATKLLTYNLVKHLSDEERTKVYYKNKIAELLENKWFQNKISELTENDYKENIEFRQIVCEFCLYDDVLYDKFKRSLKQTKKTVVLCDTDSNFLYLDPLIQDAYRIIGCEKNKDRTLSLLNMYIDICTEALKIIFWTLTNNMGIPDSHKPIIQMKNEFINSIMLMTKNKKSYAALVYAKLGKVLPEEKIDLKGLAIRKSVVAKKLRDQYTDIVINDILKEGANNDGIDLRKIVDKNNAICQEIENDIRSGGTDYAIPVKLDIVENYSNPASLQQVRGALMWNALEPNNEIVPPDRVNLFKLKSASKNAPELQELKEKYPKKYNIIMDRAFNEGPGANKNRIDISKFGFDVIAIPKSAERIPEYIIPLIDYETMVDNNASSMNIILSSLGIYCGSMGSSGGKSNVTVKSNIIEI